MINPAYIETLDLLTIDGWLLISMANDPE